MKHYSSMIKKISNASIAAVISLLISWSAGLLFIIKKHYITSTWEIWGYGIFNIVLAVGLINLLLFPLLYLTRKYKASITFLHIVFSLVILVELISLYYFSITLSLLDKSVFQFSLDQVTIIFDAYFVFKWYYLLIPVPVLAYFFTYRILKIKQEKWIYGTFLLFGVLSLFIKLQIESKNTSYSELSQNKVIYLVRSFISKNRQKFIKLSEEEILFYQENTNPLLQNKTYPLYHKTNTANPLAPFFELKENPPNIVFIIIEGLSSSFSGPNADDISYTPFLDSLANHSLYFDNSVATSERSFAALPSIVGSLPHGKGSFASNPLGYPKNETLATWLFDNGYTGDFLYGGYARFDNMDLFMHNQGFENIYDHKEYNYEGTGLQTSVDEVPFGIPDKQLFKKTIEVANQRGNSKPFFDVYFTLSMHYPFIIENEKEYLKKVNKLIAEAPVDEKIKDKNKKYQKELATFMYTDDALKYYFQEQEKRKAHQNTIYIIVGDHMMGEIAQNSHLEKYRSVLMIYSPLLKRNKLIKGVNSHLDIAPSLYNLIQQEYSLPSLDSVSWLGHPFDTSSTFNSSRDVLLMVFNRVETEIIHKNYFMAKDQLYKISDRLQVEPLDDPEKSELLRKLLKVSTTIHDEVVSYDLLVPNSAISKRLYSGEKNFVITDKKEYYSIYYTALDQPIKEIDFELDMVLGGGWTADDKNDYNPRLVYSVSRNNKTLSWNTLDLELTQKAIHEERHYKIIISNNLEFDLEEGDEISVYFWNHSLSEKVFEVNLPFIDVRIAEL